MPLLFVHGVFVRRDSDYEVASGQRNALFRRLTLSQISCQDTEIHNPYWGDLGANPRWNHGSLPADNTEEFGEEAPDAIDELAQALLLETNLRLERDGQETLLNLAKQSFPEVIDALFALAISLSEEGNLSTMAELSDKANAYATAFPTPGWLGSVNDDTEFVNKLKIELRNWTPPQEHEDSQAEAEEEAFGWSEIWDYITEGGSRITSIPARLGSGLALSLGRRPLHKAVSIFLGDAFIYLKNRQTDDDVETIQQRLLTALDQASAERTDNDPLIIVAHSMGGNIIYDLLTQERPNLTVDAFVTVGSQVSLFEELKLFQISDDSIPNPQVKQVRKPANVKHWLNVFDTNDVLSFACEAVFEGVSDFEYSTGKGLMAAHSTYFYRPSFHRRLGQRLKDLLGL